MAVASATAECVDPSSRLAKRLDSERLRCTIIICEVVVGTYALLVGGIRQGSSIYNGRDLGPYLAAFAYATCIVNAIVIFTLLNDKTGIPKSVLRKARIFYLLCSLVTMIIVGRILVRNASFIPGWDAPNAIGCLVLLGFIHNLLGVSEELQTSPPTPANGCATNITLQSSSDTTSQGGKEEYLSKQGISDNAQIVICN